MLSRNELGLLGMVVERFIQHKKGLVSGFELIFLLIKDTFATFQLLFFLMLPIVFSIVMVLGFVWLVLKLLMLVLGVKLASMIVYFFGFGMLSLATISAIVDLIKESKGV